MTIELDPSWNVDVLRPESLAAVSNPVDRIVESLRHPVDSPPLEELAKRENLSNSVCIVVSDATRPVPSHHIVEAIVRVLREANLSYDQVTLLVATGLHRRCTQQDIDHILGPRLRDKIRTISHDARNDEELRFMGMSRDGTPIYINKHFLHSDFRILTGYVEPHFFFGFSGGSKSVVPGIAGQATIQGNHSPQNMASPHARFGKYYQNPMAQNSLEIAERVGIDFVVNVCINEKHNIVEVASGGLETVHRSLVDLQMQHVFRQIEKQYDIVVSGNGGFPLDLNLYQSVKSMALGEIAVKRGGTIISVNECSEGIGVEQDEFRDLLFSGVSPEEITRRILSREIDVPDQWQIQVLARVLQKAEVIMVSKLGPQDLGNIGLEHASSLREAIERGIIKHGADARVLILPNGPQVIPMLR